MLKTVKLKDRKIPVPVPIKTLYQALQWIDQTLAENSALVTKVILDEQDLTGQSVEEQKRVPLTEASNLQVFVESPLDLILQSIEMVRDLAIAVANGLEKISVDVYAAKVSPRLQVRSLINDLGLIVGLVDEINDLVDRSHRDVAPIIGLNSLIKRACVRLEASLKDRNWRKCGIVLATYIRPLCLEIQTEAMELQLRILGDGHRTPVERSREQSGA